MARTYLGPAALVLSIAAGCYSGTAVGTADGGAPSPSPSTSSTPTPTASSTGTSSGTTGTADGLPCDVATVLAVSCGDCHGATLAGGAPNHLVSLSDLTKPSASDPSKSVAAVAVARMQDAADPMPPSGPASASDVAVLSAWVAAGTPAGAACGSSTDAGADADAGGEYNTPTVCTSGTTWTQGDLGSKLMHPGEACIDCHSQENGPTFVIAGTVFPTAHEPDDCNGDPPAGLTVVITDADGKTHTWTPNSAGNFYSETAIIPLPYQAVVVSSSGTRAMVGAQTSGDCNSCHTTAGTQGAPGRIMAP